MRGWKLVAAERLTECERLRSRILDLEDRLQSRDLAQFKVLRGEGGFAMPEPDHGDDDVWATDLTGLVREKLPPLTAEEQAYADRLA